ncbi:DUF4367 domain-containing protein [Paenibacillus dendritiformis]|uniref:DUF4367 domain-containing protein n=1 Tax=Paenibacillus dendritiformis TaxID=130049 RepID=UPI00143D68A7|nr:DUF4367 domain-containing protein [Paenibacillus dendritiformis]NKI22204.1 DUF4367 domain-containing protein [Paenibacillus dendritiformis]NRG00733.1 DUF4367 domain-containing protein [Paenibacillus dendritiformis]
MKTKKTIALALASLMLLSAFSTGMAYAAPAAAETNKTRKASAEKKARWKTQSEALEWMYKNKKDEELMALYDPSDGLVMFYEGMFKLKTYKEFTKKQAQYKGPAIPEPGGLPDGYRFKFGTVYSQYPRYMVSKEYQQIQQQLKAEAAEKGERYYFKKLDWDKSNRSELTYEKDKNYLKIIAEYMEELPEGVTLLPEKGVTREKLEIGGTEAAYVTYADKKKGADRLEWNSGDGTVKFRITSFGSGSVSKEEMIAVAETIIAAKAKK